MPTDDRFREILRLPDEALEPSEEQMEKARAALHRAYRTEGGTGRPAWWLPAIGWAGAAAVVVAVAVLTLPGSTPAVDANLDEIARAARTLSAEELPAGAYIYVHRESTVLISSSLEQARSEIFYLLPTSIDGWRQGTTEERRVTVGSPTFFEEAAAAAYYDSGEDSTDRVGETFTERLGDIRNQTDIAGWPTDVDALRDQLEADLLLSGSPGLEDSINALQMIESLMDPSLKAPPALRAALLEILGSFDVTTEMSGDTVRVSLQGQESGLGLVLRELDFDGNGFMTRTAVTVLEPDPRLPVPPGTVIRLETLTRPAVVDASGMFPGG